MKQKTTKKSQQLWSQAKKIIPGGSQLLSKRVEMLLPEQWPAYFQKAKGVEVIDLDGNKFIDMSLMGVGPYVLGYADPDVDRAVKKVIARGTASTLNCPEEVELAELLIKLHPWSGMVRFARTGGEAVAIAVRIARAYTKKDKIAFCGYHGWHDWYLSANLEKDSLAELHLSGLSPVGVPQGLAGTNLPFHYNRIEQLEQIVKGNDIGTIIMEPIRHQEPENDFLQKVRKIADEIGAVLIYDEISSGFRQNAGGIHLLYKVIPDIAVFGKSISNGYPMSAVVGKEKIMQAAQETFISSTYWSEGIGPTAALATIKKMQAKKVGKHIEMIGGLIWRGWKELAEKHNLKIKITGPKALVNFSFDYANAQEIKTLFIQEMLKRGFLATLVIYVSYGHSPKHVARYLKAVDEVFKIIKKAIDENKINDLLEGPVAHQGFKRLT